MQLNLLITDFSCQNLSQTRMHDFRFFRNLHAILGSANSCNQYNLPRIKLQWYSVLQPLLLMHSCPITNRWEAGYKLISSQTLSFTIGVDILGPSTHLTCISKSIALHIYGLLSFRTTTSVIIVSSVSGGKAWLHPNIQ